MKPLRSRDIVGATRMAFAVVIVVGAAACEPRPPAPVPVAEEVSPVAEPLRVPEAERMPLATQDQRCVATLSPVNRDLLRANPSGQVELVVGGETLEIAVRAAGMPPGIVHLQHFHGFADGTPARCPGPGADANGDGVVDVTETEAMAGVTMVPFHDDPTSLEIKADTYPQADAEGSYTYRQVASLDQLQKAFRDRFGGELALDRRVVFVHGVPEDVNLPDSANSVMDVPAHVTLPIACGELSRVE